MSVTVGRRLDTRSRRTELSETEDEPMMAISIITPCYNEEDNVEELYKRVQAEMVKIGKYRYEHIFIDNSSRDNTVAILKRIASRDQNVKIIVNSRNFGHVRSPMHA